MHSSSKALEYMSDELPRAYQNASRALQYEYKIHVILLPTNEINKNLHGRLVYLLSYTDKTSLIVSMLCCIHLCETFTATFKISVQSTFRYLEKKSKIIPNKS